MADLTEQQLLSQDPEVLGLQRQRQLANLLTGQAFNQPQGQVISGHYVKPSALQQALPMINAAIGGMTNANLDEKQLALANALRGRGVEETQKILELAKTNPNEALALASNAQTPQGKAFAPALMQSIIPKKTDKLVEYDTYKSEGGKKLFSEWSKEITPEQQAKLDIDKQRLGLEAARFNLEKSKAEVNPAEAGLRSSFLNQAQPHIQISQAYRKIESAPDTAAGDMSKIFGFMKILDPGSTVREGEYASAENARGVPDTVKAQYNKVISGQRLSPDQRVQFTQAAGDLVNSQKQQFGEVAKYYGDISSRNRINPENIIYDPYKDLNVQTTPPKQPKPVVNINQQLGVPQATNGWNIIGVTPSR
jgi:hypothetical protein